MKTICLLILFLILDLICVADLGKPPVEWGKFSKEELQMKVYDQDTSASAVILTKYGSLSFDNRSSHLNVVYEYLIRIKILNENGFKYGDVKIPYNTHKDTDRILELKAHTINPTTNGNFIITEVNKDMIIDERQDAFYHMRKFAFPELHKGSIIEYYYKIKSDDYYFIKEWEFKDEIPIAYCEYRTSIPDIFKYSIMTRGLENFNELEHDKTFMSFGRTMGGLEQVNVDITAYKMKNVKSIHQEPYSIQPTSYGNFNMQLNSYTLPGDFTHNVLKDWKEIGEFFDKADFLGDQLHSYSVMKEEALRVTEGKSNQKDKISAIYNYVKANITWNQDYDLQIDDLKTSFINKTGNGTEVNSIMLCMLRAAGITADPVIVCTRTHGMLMKEFTFLRQFNHMVVKAQAENKEEIILDANDIYRPINLPNQDLLNTSGLCFNEKDNSWIDISSKAKSKRFINYLLTLDNNDIISGKSSYACNNYSAIFGRHHINGEGVKEYYGEIIKEKEQNIHLDSIQVSNLDSLGGNLIINSKVSLSVGTGDKNIYVTPITNADLHNNPFKEEMRFSPVEFIAPQSETSTMTLNIPADYKIVEIPKSIKVTLPDSAASFIFISSDVNNIIQIKSVLTVDKLFFPVEEYAELRDFFSSISRKYSEQIVISKP